MYVTEIDNLLDKALDKFMQIWLIDKKNKLDLITLQQITKEINFTRYQKEINLLFTVGMNITPESEITAFVTKNSNILLVKNILSRYIAYYIFLQIGISYAGKTKQFNNNLVEFNRSQPSHTNIIDDFFNTESNANILNMLSVFDEFKQYISTHQSAKKKETKKDNKLSPDFKKIIDGYTPEMLDKIIDMLDTKDKEMDTHNIIKLLLYKMLYEKEQKQIFDTIEMSETTDEEFIFIEIIVPHTVKIDVTAIENILAPRDVKRHVADTISQMINERDTEAIDDIRKNFVSYDDKIQKLFNRRIVVPIVDDFLLYHKNSEKYEESFKTAQNKNENTKIKYIVNKLNNVTTYYKHPEEVKQLMYAQESRKNAVLINRFENNKIEGYIEKTTIITADNYDTVNDFNNYMSNAYVPFRYSDKNGFNFVNDLETITVIRKCSFNGKNKKLLTHELAQNSLALIVGYAFFNEDMRDVSLSSIDVSKLSDYTMSKKIVPTILELIERKSEEFLEEDLNEFNKEKYAKGKIYELGKVVTQTGGSKAINALRGGREAVSEATLLKGVEKKQEDDSEDEYDEPENRRSSPQSVASVSSKDEQHHSTKHLFPSYFLFNLEDNKFWDFPNLTSTATINKNELVKMISAQMFDKYIEFIIAKFKQVVKQNNLHNAKLPYEYNINNYTRLLAKYPDINKNIYKEEVADLQNMMYREHTKASEYDENEDAFRGLTGDIIRLPTMPKKIPPNVPKIRLEFDFEMEYAEGEGKAVDVPEQVLQMSEELEDINAGIENDLQLINATCQHRISLQKLSTYESTRKASYPDDVYAFIQQYVKVNFNQDFVCKSCGNNINELKSHVLDGVYNNVLQRYEGFSINITDHVEDMPEYLKYRIAIRNIDKIIDRIASTTGVTELSGLSYSARTTRNKLMKNIIDFILIHNEYLAKYYIQNKQKRGEEVGINRGLSNLFTFKLDNNIFVFSTADADSLKLQKYNNIIGYIVIFMLLDMDEIQIINLLNDTRSKTGICNYEVFKKNMDIIFQNFKIVVNTSGDLDKMVNYPILCYITFIFTCFIIKYNLWANTFDKLKEKDDGKKKTAKEKQKQLFSILQKSAINTTIELLNSTLMADVHSRLTTNPLKTGNHSVSPVPIQKQYLYDILTTKYYIKLPLFKSSELVSRLDDMYINKKAVEYVPTAKTETTKYDIDMSKKQKEIVQVDDLYDIHVRPKALSRQNFPYTKNHMLPMRITEVSNLTNCLGDGEFHNFRAKMDKKEREKNKDYKYFAEGDELVCTKCGVHADLALYVPDSHDEIVKDQEMRYYRRLATKYCPSGKIHDFKKVSEESEERQCANCKYIEGNAVIMDKKELIKLYDNVQKIIMKNNIHVEKLVSQINIANSEEVTRIKKIFDKLMYKFHKNNENIMKSIDTFTDSVEQLIGINITINDQVYNTQHNIYIIDHDYYGNRMKTPIRHYENENKFRVIENHTTFGRPVIAYVMQGNVKHELYYDQYSKFLLGYRESGKKIIPVEKNTTKLIINYSVKNMLRMFGFMSDIIDIKDVLPELFGFTEKQMAMAKKDGDIDMNKIVNSIASRRYGIVKNFGYLINKYVTRFKYNYKVELQYTFNQSNNTYVLNENDNDPYDIIYNKFHNKIEPDIVTSKEETTGSEAINASRGGGKATHTFMKYINPIVEYMPMENIVTKMEFSQYVDYDYVLKHDFSGNITLNYVMDEINRLIGYNDAKAMKRNITMFMLEIMYKMFNLTNYDIYRQHKEHYALVQSFYSSMYFTKMQEVNAEDAIDYLNDNSVDIEELTEEEQKKLQNEIDDNREEQQALDMDEEMDVEDEYCEDCGEDYE
jgi:hypothetical protein